MDIFEYLLAKNNAGGGSFAIKELCYATETTDAGDIDYAHIASFTSITPATGYDNYLEYDSVNNLFIVKKDFNALINAWVYQYKSANSSTSEGELYINDEKVGEYKNLGTGRYLTDGIYLQSALKAGDTIYCKTPRSDGFPMQRIKIAEISELSAGVFQSLTYMAERNMESYTP